MRQLPPRIALAAIGLLLTPIYWAAVFAFAAGMMMGDCRYEGAPDCISDRGRQMFIIGGTIVGTLVYGALIAFWRWLDDGLAGRPR